jgi:hypothetical protein
MLDCFFNAVVGICCTVLVVKDVVNQVPEICYVKKRKYALKVELKCIKYCLFIILIPVVLVAGFPKLMISNFVWCHASD